MRLALLLLAGCSAVASPDDGYGDLLVVDGAQFRPGPFPAQSGGPATLSVQPVHSSIVVGRERELLAGVLEPAATSAILGVSGGRGSWIAHAGPPDIDTPDDASLHVTYGLDPSFPPGPFTIEIAAVDASGRIGPAMGADLLALPDQPPSGELVVALDWPGAADLDLHVIDPAGDEAWIGDPNTWKPPPPGNPVDPCAYLTGGMLDLDANQDCRRDADPSEHVVWAGGTCAGMQVAPIVPAGTYTVRVEAKSLCTDASAPWLVTVFHQGTAIASARGIATPDDAEYGKHGAGAGVTALTFTLP